MEVEWDYSRIVGRAIGVCSYSDRSVCLGQKIPLLRIRREMDDEVGKTMYSRHSFRFDLTEYTRKQYPSRKGLIAVDDEGVRERDEKLHYKESGGLPVIFDYNILCTVLAYDSEKQCGRF